MYTSQALFLHSSSLNDTQHHSSNNNFENTIEAIWIADLYQPKWVTKIQISVKYLVFKHIMSLGIYNTMATIGKSSAWGPGHSSVIKYNLSSFWGPTSPVQ